MRGWQPFEDSGHTENFVKRLWVPVTKWLAWGRWHITKWLLWTCGIEQNDHHIQRDRKRIESHKMVWVELFVPPFYMRERGCSALEYNEIQPCLRVKIHSKTGWARNWAGRGNSLLFIMDFWGNIYQDFSHVPQIAAPHPYTQGFKPYQQRHIWIQNS